MLQEKSLDIIKKKPTPHIYPQQSSPELIRPSPVELLFPFALVVASKNPSTAWKLSTYVIFLFIWLSAFPLVLIVLVFPQTLKTTIGYILIWLFQKYLYPALCKGEFKTLSAESTICYQILKNRTHFISNKWLLLQDSRCVPYIVICYIWSTDLFHCNPQSKEKDNLHASKKIIDKRSGNCMLHYCITA